MTIYATNREHSKGDALPEETPKIAIASHLPPATEQLLRPAARAPLFSNSQVHLDDASTATKPPPPPAVKSSRKTRRKSTSKSNRSKASALEDYFKEETEKSRAIDGPSVASKASPSSVPPPPRITKNKKVENTD